jgi:hypothetical protein
MRTTPLLVLSLLASACAGDPSGIWMLQYTPSDGDDTTCTTVGTENFTDGAFPEDEVGTTDGDWVYTESHTSSDVLFFVQIDVNAAGEGLLLLGDQAYPGTSDQGTWTFSWTAEDTDSSRAEHVDGYHLTEDSAASSSTTFTFTPSGATADGTMKSDTETVSSYGETDEWDPRDNDVYSGSIPSDAYLEDADGYSIDNEYDADDCDGDTCSISVTETCSGTLPVVGTKTNYQDEDAYQHLMSAGQGD